MTTRYEVRAGEGVGAIAFGMPRDTVRELLGDPEESHAFDDANETQDYWPDDGLSVLYDAAGACAEILLFAPAEAQIRGVPLLGSSLAEVESALRGLAPDAVREDDQIVVRSLAMALQLPTDEEDEGAVLYVIEPRRFAGLDEA